MIEDLFGDQAWAAGSHGFRREEAGMEIAQRYSGGAGQNPRRHRQFRYVGAVGCAAARLRNRSLECAIPARYTHRGPVDYQPKKLSREQCRVLDEAERRGECVGISAINLLEIALLNKGRQRLSVSLDQVFRELDTNPAFRIFPLYNGHPPRNGRI